MSKLNTSKTTWDLSPLLAGDDDPKITEYRSQMTTFVDGFAAKWRDRTDYLNDPAVLKEALDELEASDRIPGSGNESFYFGLRSAQDTLSAEIKAKENQSNEFLKALINKLQFFWLTVGTIDPDIQKTMLAATELEPYKHALERAFANARYRLSEPEEKILMLKSTPAHSQWVQMTDTFLAKAERTVLKESGKPAVAGKEEMLTLIASTNKAVRDSSGKTLNSMFAELADLAEAEVNAILTNKKIDDDLRGYTRPDESRHMADDIDSAVVDALIAAVSDRNDIAQRFMNLKAALIGQPKLAYYERGVPYGNEASDISYDFDEASELVYDVFSDLDEDFARIFKHMLEGGQFDVFPKKGKTGGAFCARYEIVHPTYVLLNHTNKLRDVTTIAHEMGHAINNELIKARENSLNYSTPTSTAEVASTFMEDFVLERLMADADAETELKLRVDKLGDLTSAIFRQVACYRFEQDLHRVFREQGYISKDEINRLFTANMTAYLGEHAEGAENWWVYWMHFRRFFYVYSYASGQLISSALQSKVRSDKSFMKNVKEFLSTGTSRSPKNIFGDMGIDISDKHFWSEGLGEIEKLLDETEALAKKLGKL